MTTATIKRPRPKGRIKSVDILEQGKCVAVTIRVSSSGLITGKWFDNLEGAEAVEFGTEYYEKMVTNEGQYDTARKPQIGKTFARYYMRSHVDGNMLFVVIIRRTNRTADFKRACDMLKLVGA
jgi:hypothetical protein